MKAFSFGGKKPTAKKPVPVYCVVLIYQTFTHVVYIQFGEWANDTAFSVSCARQKSAERRLRARRPVACKKSSIGCPIRVRSPTINWAATAPSLHSRKPEKAASSVNAFGWLMDCESQCAIKQRGGGERERVGGWGGGGEARARERVFTYLWASFFT